MKVRASGSRIEAASWVPSDKEGDSEVAREVEDDTGQITPEGQLRVTKVELAWVMTELEVVGLCSD